MADGQAGRQAGRKMEGYKYKEAGRQTGRQEEDVSTKRQGGRQTGRDIQEISQTDTCNNRKSSRQMNRQREQQTNRQIKFGIFYKLEKELQKRKVY
jgi:hypothetical protein